MPILYRYQPDEIPSLAGPSFVDEYSDSWWAGTQKCFVGLALAATLSANIQATQIAEHLQWQDEPTARLSAQPPDEDNLWINWVQPVRALVYQKLPYLPDPEEIPTLHGQPDEDFWNNPIAPSSLKEYWPQQWAFDNQEDVPQPIIFQPDEDLWIRPTYIQNPLQWSQQWKFDEQIPVLHGQYDEDFWTNWVAPSRALLAYPQQFSFETIEIVAQAAANHLDEDYFWQSGMTMNPRIVFQQSNFDVDNPRLSTPVSVSGIHYIPQFRRRRR